MYVSYLPVPAFLIYVLDQFPDPRDIVRDDRRPVVEYVIYRHYRYVARRQLHHVRIAEIYTGEHHAVISPVSAMLQIVHVHRIPVAVDEAYVVALGLCRLLERIQHRCIEVMRKPVPCLISEEYAYVVALVRLQRSGGSIRKISHLLGCLPDTLFGCLSYIAVVIQCLTYRRNRNAHFFRYIFHRDHYAFLCLNRFRK